MNPRDPEWVLLEAARLVELSTQDLLDAVANGDLSPSESSAPVEELQRTQRVLQRLAAAYVDERTGAAVPA